MFDSWGIPVSKEVWMQILLESAEDSDEPT